LCETDSFDKIARSCVSDNPRNREHFAPKIVIDILNSPSTWPFAEKGNGKIHPRAHVRRVDGHQRLFGTMLSVPLT
jgi:hypothetical protein